MRLRDDAGKLVFALGLSLPLAACGSASAQQPLASIDTPAGDAIARFGPEADYPQVLGEPFVVDGQTYTPEDIYSYDAVGYAALEAEGAGGVSVAHKTLPLPSYVEVTSLTSGKTILARVERRGPMTAQRLVALSPAAAAQLGLAEGEPVRVRRVNAPEAERAELRAGNQVAERLATPDSLLAVLRKKLPTAGDAVSLALPARPAAPTAVARADVAPSTAAPAPVTKPATAPATAKPARPVPVATAKADAADGSPVPKAQVPDPKGKFAVQAAAFSSRANADNLARKLEGAFVTQSGNFYRVRVGPYATRGQAEAALAKVRAAGYSDAKVVSAG
ncbi:SPOR domain-containing protein [Parerythrobacter aurantius]|uniref:SPOR domain-containing protein n=1 Tax=Parerythrobacter aurantius TaxID=3127706 RepID=UPI00324AA875